ncbi:hypothetical protein Tco_1054558 [Tanacetum coccineum]|uniref:Uncharacterized protein n=1 Tax=Tanacetum coccineum TaxID=301880 RepID=A0ABQ5GYC0_9ASTR
MSKPTLSYKGKGKDSTGDVPGGRPPNRPRYEPGGREIGRYGSRLVVDPLKRRFSAFDTPMDIDLALTGTSSTPTTCSYSTHHSVYHLQRSALIGDNRLC